MEFVNPFFMHCVAMNWRGTCPFVPTSTVDINLNLKEIIKQMKDSTLPFKCFE